MNAAAHARPRKIYLIVALLVVAFLFRLGFGLSSEFWFEDELQIYLIGLKFFATGAWPYFGPDVACQVQIPGALQGLLIGLPLFAAPFVEAPFVLLNLISFAALALFAWFCCRRLPEIPPLILWAWLMTAPWTLDYSTHVTNTSYILPGSILFFVGAFELCPLTTGGLISAKWAAFMMGLALCWTMQFHLSWVLLVPYVIAAFYLYFKDRGKKILPALASFIVGAFITGAFVLPTYLKYGFVGGAGGVQRAITFNFGNIRRVLSPAEGVPARFLSFASFEIARFIGSHSADRWMFLRQHLWLAPVTVFLVLVGILQPIALIALWFSKMPAHKDWNAIRITALASVLLVCVSFLFSAKGPVSHTFYVLFPVAMIYSLYCWSRFLRHRGWQIFAGACVVCGVIFHAGLALHNLPRHSLYVHRDIPQAAIRTKDPGVLGQRRAGSFY